MLSYRHGFHAGNRADVLKHTVLIFCLDYLLQKPKPLLYIDTHAGAGSYLLDEGFAAQKREWAQGIGRLAPAGATAAGADAGGMTARYLSLLRAGWPEKTYPGSPLIAAALLRPQDQGCCFELHPADFITLGQTLKERPAAGRRFRVKQEDGLAGLKSLLPPPSRRALVLIDPPYELAEEYPHLIKALEDSLRRFSTGLYIIWYPLLTQPQTPGTAKGQNHGDNLMGLYNGARCRVELRFAPPPQENAHLCGCGLVIYNPPWTLKAGLEETMPSLAEQLGQDRGSWDLTWMA